MLGASAASSEPSLRIEDARRDGTESEEDRSRTMILVNWIVSAMVSGSKPAVNAGTTVSAPTKTMTPSTASPISMRLVTVDTIRHAR